MTGDGKAAFELHKGSQSRKVPKVAKILNSSKSVKDSKDAANVIDYLHQHDSGLAVVS